MAAVLSNEVVNSAVDNLDWVFDGSVLIKDIQLPSFPAAIDYVVRVGELAEAANHHPDINVRWRSVHLELSTHSAGGITQLDLDLAAAIDALMM